MDYTYPVPWHRNAKGSIELCKKPGKCKLPNVDHVEAVSADAAAYKFQRHADIHGERASQAFYVDVKPTSAGLRASESYVVSARDFANKMAAYEQQHGKTLDQVAFQGTVQLFDSVPAIRITRSFHLQDNGAYGARWELERTGHRGRSVKRRIYPYSVMEKGTGTDNVSMFLDYDYTLLDKPSLEEESVGMAFGAGGNEDPALGEARRADTLAFLYELLATVEAQAALSTHALRQDLMATAYAYCLLHKDAAGYVNGAVDYAQSGWRPEFLRNADVGEDELANVRAAYDRVELYTNSRRRRENEEARDRRAKWFADLQESLRTNYDERSIKGLSPDFVVGESRAGAATAAWTMSREGADWRLTVKGSQGQVRTAVVATPEEAYAQAHSLLSALFHRRTLATTARQVSMKLEDAEHVCGVERTRDEAIHNRAAFMASMVRETAAMERRAATVQAELARVHAAVAQFVQTGVAIPSL